MEREGKDRRRAGRRARWVGRVRGETGEEKGEGEVARRGRGRGRPEVNWGARASPPTSPPARLRRNPPRAHRGGRLRGVPIRVPLRSKCQPPKLEFAKTDGGVGVFFFFLFKQCYSMYKSFVAKKITFDCSGCLSAPRFQSIILFYLFPKRI